MIPESATHFDRDGCYYCVSDDYVMLWRHDSNTWEAMAFEPDEVVKYLELHELKSFNELSEWRDMASAPKDGSKFLLRVDKYLIKVAAYDAEEKMFKVADGLWHAGEGCEWKPAGESE